MHLDEARTLFASYGFVGPWHITKGRLPHSLIARDIMAAIGGMLNHWLYRCVARLMPHAEVYRAIFETRIEGATDLPALFMAKIKASAGEKAYRYEPANLSSNQQQKKMKKTTSPNAFWSDPIAGVAITAAKQACIYTVAQQAFPTAATRALDVMTAALRARIQHSDRRLNHGIDGP